MQFVDVIPFHPNVYEDGKVCISILHPPEEDAFGYESAAERWSPVQTPETILISVVRIMWPSSWRCQRGASRIPDREA